MPAGKELFDKTAAFVKTQHEASLKEASALLLPMPDVHCASHASRARMHASPAPGASHDSPRLPPPARTLRRR